ncbi:gas vesicle protein K [Streptomyces sioyaensis]|uniref:gas vesicle protein K n=1 Tax=Streptomyces sioyaensis TaxID=67364 RepID=UPI0037D5A0A8
MPEDPHTAPHPAFAEVAQAAARAFDLIPAGTNDRRSGSDLAQRLKTDPETVERDLIKLVLTIVELLRQLMERTALHRVDQGDLSADQEERIGMTLMVLEDRMSELCCRYGLTMSDLNLDLGPLGSLLPKTNSGLDHGTPSVTDSSP